jgi:hypothetical protein
MSEHSERISDAALSLRSSEDGIPAPPKAAV